MGVEECPFLINLDLGMKEEKSDIKILQDLIGIGLVFEGICLSVGSILWMC